MAAPDKLELLRSALSQNHTLFTAHRKASQANTTIRVDCFASKGVGNTGLMKITELVAGVLKYRRSPLGLIISNKDEADRNLVAALSRKLELDLKHERVL